MKKKDLKKEKFEQIKNLSKVIGGKIVEYPTFTQTGTYGNSDSDMTLDYRDNKKLD